MNLVDKVNKYLNSQSKKKTIKVTDEELVLIYFRT